METINKNNGVPGIPLGALDAIQDQNTRMVLQAVIDGVHVRNGVVGNGDSAFITRAELLGGSGGAGSNTSASLVGQAVARDINTPSSALYASIFESRLFKYLQERVKLIDETNIKNGNTIIREITDRSNADNSIYVKYDAQITAINQSVAAIQTTQTTTTNNVAALASTVTILQASVANNTAAIAQEALVRANVDGTLLAQYTLRVDVNGRVSGFGIAANATRTDFIIRTDTFSLVSPSGNTAAMIIENNTINVFDENGALRVKLGRL